MLRLLTVIAGFAHAMTNTILEPKDIAKMSYNEYYTFAIISGACDGACVYCREARLHHIWNHVRMLTSYYVFEHRFNNVSAVYSSSPEGLRQKEIQDMINWSWESGVKFECTPGIISMRLLTYQFPDARELFEGEVITFLEAMNCHTGIWDILQSSWPALMAAGWPLFQQLVGISRKLRRVLYIFGDEDGHAKENEYFFPHSSTDQFPNLPRENNCDISLTERDRVYIMNVNEALRMGYVLPLSFHIGVLIRRPTCPLGTAVALLGMVQNLIIHQGMYQGAIMDGDNVIVALLMAIQEMVVQWTKEIPSIRRWFDTLTTDWPIWAMLGVLSCVDSERACTTRSAIRCYDPLSRNFLPCPYAPSYWKKTYTMCGEHDVCEAPQAYSAKVWCIPRNATTNSEPWVRTINHDAEERLCSQCGQDGIIRFIFNQIGFRPLKDDEMPYYVEFGARKPHMLNSSYLREYCKWHGLLMDFQPGNTTHGGCGDGCRDLNLVKQEYVTAENINDLFDKYEVPEDFDFLTIDIDFNDYWIWKAVLEKGKYKPRLVAVDFNPDIELDQAKTVPYDAHAEWDGTRYTTASLLAYTLLAQRYNYSYITSLEMGAHAFFVRQDLLHTDDHNAPLRAPRKQSHMPDAKTRAMVDTIYSHLKSL